MALYTNMSTTSELDARLMTIYDSEFSISAENTFTKGLPTLCSKITEIDGKTWSHVKYSKLTRVTSALTEDADVTRQAMSDTAITITPAEYGSCVTPTNLAVLQSGGMPAVAAVRLQAVNMAESIENKMILVGEAGTNELIIGQSAESSLIASNTMTAAYVKYAYNKLQRAGIPGPYYAVMHSDIVYDLQLETGTQGWTEISNYADPGSVLRNEIGMFGGFRFIISPMVTVNTDAGASAVDSYHSQFFGFNAFGYSESQEPGGRITGPFDALARFVNIGWYGVYEFGLVDTDAHWLITCASSIGTNT